MTVQEPIRASRPTGPVNACDPASDWSRSSPDRSPLLAVCGLCGGAGTSTLSYLLARFAVTEARGDVLVCDTGGPAGGLAACARVQSQWSLLEAADRVSRGLPLTGGLFAVDEPASLFACELRVIATGPRLTESGGVDGLGALLEMARSDGAHALTVVDCGTLALAADRVVLRAASHIAWVLPATSAGLRRAERVLVAIGSDLAGRELIVARRDRRQPAAELRKLRTLAERRHAPLVLLPHLSDPLDRPARALDEAQVALQALIGALAR